VEPMALKRLCSIATKSRVAVIFSSLERSEMLTLLTFRFQLHL